MKEKREVWAAALPLETGRAAAAFSRALILATTRS
jgi:hypothetical protein